MISNIEISVNEVIARAKMQLGIDSTSEHDNYLNVLVEEGVRSLNALSLFIKKDCVLDIVDGRAKLPYGFMKLLAMRFTVDNNDGKKSYNPIIYVDTKFLNSLNINNHGYSNYSNSAKIVGNYIHFNTNDIKSSKIEVSYYSLNISDDGNIVIYLEYERALMHYICWMFMLRYFDKYNSRIIDEHYRNFVNQKAQIRSSAFKREGDRTRMELASISNAIIADKTVDWNI